MIVWRRFEGFENVLEEKRGHSCSLSLSSTRVTNDSVQLLLILWRWVVYTKKKNVILFYFIYFIFFILIFCLLSFRLNFPLPCPKPPPIICSFHNKTKMESASALIHKRTLYWTVCRIFSTTQCSIPKNIPKHRTSSCSLLFWNLQWLIILGCFGADTCTYYSVDCVARPSVPFNLLHGG